MDMDKFKEKQLIIAKRKQARIEKRRKIRERQERKQKQEREQQGKAQQDHINILQYLEELGKKQNKELQYFYLCSWKGGIADILLSFWFHYIRISKNTHVFPIFLLDFKTNSEMGNTNCYNTNLFDLLSFKQNNIICNSYAIENIIHHHKNNMSKSIFIYDYLKNKPTYTNKIIRLNPIVTGGTTKSKTCKFFFHHVVFKKDILDYFRDKIKELPSDIAFIQIRHTDRVCDYKQYLQKNNDFLHTYDKFYVATDNESCVSSLRNLYPLKKFYNFTTFKNKGRQNLHHSTSLSGYIKLRDVFFDLCIASKSKAWFSCSKGGFKCLTKWSYRIKPTCFGL